MGTGLPLFVIFAAVFADTIDPDLHSGDFTGKSSLEQFRINMQEFRPQAIHLAAATAVEMGVRGMMSVWRQTIIGSPATGTQFLKNSVFNQQIENAVHRHPVNRLASTNHIVDIACRKGAAAAADHLQHLQAIGGCLKACRLKEFCVVTVLTHGHTSICFLTT